MSVLSVRDLEVTYATQAGPIPAVRGVSLDIDKGEVLGLAGESGCGKSTVVNAILRLLPPGATTSGQVLLNDEDVLTMKPGRLRAVRWTGASVVFQGAMHALNPVQRIGDQLAEAVVIHRQSNQKEAHGPGRETSSRRSACRRGASATTRTSCRAGRSSG